jgi:starch phosphorylase
MNEGTGFLQFERLSRRMKERGLHARSPPCRTSVFTTHTPVAAGNGLRRAADPRYSSALRRVGSPGQWLALGSNDHGEPNQPFNMTALAIRTSSRINGVSEVNARVSARMWHHLIPSNGPEGAQLRAITNGVHHPSWLGLELQELFTSWFGERWPQVVTSRRAKPSGRT